MIATATNDSLDIDESQEVVMNQPIHSGRLSVFATLHRYTQRMRKIASVAVLIILLYIVMLVVSAILPQGSRTSGSAEISSRTRAVGESSSEL